MLFKLATRNIRRSISDYAIYFVTLTIGVAIFYAFNSIDSQQVLFDLEEADAKMFDLTQYVLSLFSGVISFVLGFLVIYANQFLIKRRKKEFGTYLLLGMGAESVSLIVLIETVIVGIMALALGLMIGFLLSQGLSFATAAMFGIQIKNYQFIFSADACFMTLACFALIFVVVGIFNTFSVNRYKLIDLLNADKQNQRGGTRNPIICLLVFIASLFVIAYAYEQLIENKMIMLDDPTFIRATIGMLIGSLMFFWSLAGFAIAIITRIRGVYLKGLSMFSVRQVASRINTAFLSLWAVCILLFFSITTFSCGMGLVKVFTDDMESIAPFDATIESSSWYDDYKLFNHPDSASLESRAKEMQAGDPVAYDYGVKYDWDLASAFKDLTGEKWDQLVSKSAQLNSYEAIGTKYNQLYEQARTADPTIEITEDHGFLPGNDNILVLPISEVNDTLDMLGMNQIDIRSDQFAILNNFGGTEPLCQLMAKNGFTLTVGGTALTASSVVTEAQLADSAMASTLMAIAVPDSIIDDFISKGAIPYVSYLNIEYKDGITDPDKLLEDIIIEAEGYSKNFWPVYTSFTQKEMVSQAGGLKMMIIYLALYIGFIFLMATATILAIQRLSDAADSQTSYRTLMQLGCDSKMVNRSILAQTLIYFLVPLGLAICHSICAIGVLNASLLTPFGKPVVEPIAMAACLVVGIYGLYMIITYVLSKSVVRSN